MTLRFIGYMMMVVAAVLSLGPRPVAAQTPASLPRTADGRPDLSGVWQAVNTAAWDLEAHHATKDAPAGLGVVDGGEIPYQPWAAAKRDENFANRANGRSGREVPSPWRASRHVSAVPVPDSSERRTHCDRVRVCAHGSACFSWTLHIPVARLAGTWETRAATGKGTRLSWT